MTTRKIKPIGRAPHTFKPTCGIYAIVHKPSKRRYVGSSSQVEKRLYLHLVSLRTNKHHCGYLQNVWNKYGEFEFVYRLLQVCSVEELAKCEQFYMDSTEPKLLMNCYPIARSSRGFKHSSATRRKMSKAARALATLEERKIRSSRAKAQHAAGNFGQATWTKEVKARVAALTRRGCKNNKSKLTTKKVREIRRKYVPYKYNQRKLAKEYGVCQTAIRMVLNRKHWSHVK